MVLQITAFTIPIPVFYIQAHMYQRSSVYSGHLLTATKVGKCPAVKLSKDIWQQRKKLTLAIYRANTVTIKIPLWKITENFNFMLFCHSAK